jgi:hypothetical protein
MHASEFSGINEYKRLVNCVQWNLENYPIPVIFVYSTGKNEFARYMLVFILVSVGSPHAIALTHLHDS